jgi:hypothetical protein
MRLCDSAGAGSCWRESEAVDIKLSSQTGKLRDPGRASEPIPPLHHWPNIYRVLTFEEDFDHVFLTVGLKTINPIYETVPQVLRKVNITQPSYYLKL